MALRHELTAQRKVTHGFIMTQPVALQLRRSVKVKLPTGGTKLEESVLPETQVLRLVEPGSMPYPTVTADGVERKIDFMLLGEWNADIERYDSFTHGGKEWEVVELLFDNGYERRALVSARG